MSPDDITSTSRPTEADVPNTSPPEAEPDADRAESANADAGTPESETRRRVRTRATTRQPEQRAADDADADAAPTRAPRRGGGRDRRRPPASEAPDAIVPEVVETPGVVNEPEVEVEVAVEDAPVVRRRRRRRADEPDEVENAELDVVEPPQPDEVADANARVAGDEDGGGQADEDTDTAGAEAGEEDATSRPTRSRRGRRRGGRGRRGRGRGRGADADGEAVAGKQPRDAEEGDTAPDTEDAAGTEAPAPPTRLSARTRKSSSRRTRSTGRAPRRAPGEVSVETRRAIADGPPKRMLVSAGDKRTQIVVMEERNLVEHYVTRREDVSYVGNVYLGRVQNVLPGMEAAFVDIGKGRNGVLYAGEVNYDEADLDGQLPRIEQTLKPGQTLLVQVTKDPMGTKGARLTQQLSIAGRYCVLAPGDGMLGISRKLGDDERDRLRAILKSIKPEGYGLIVRTAAEGASAEQLEADVQRLTRIWEQVRSRAEQANPLDAVYEEPPLHIRVIRDVFGSDFSDLIVDSDELAEEVRGYLRDVSPELTDKVTVYSGDGALFDAYEVTNQIRRALEKKVWLRSGGYLIVEKTEAMWVIDVNTGKFVGKSNLEETVLRNNLEAAEEIARQLRLRDMGGIIVIDFVDMLVPSNRDEVLKRFKRELARDRTKSRVMEISKLGLVQMTRKNVSQGLNESFTTVCDCCEGRGAVIAESMLG